MSSTSFQLRMLSLDGVSTTVDGLKLSNSFHSRVNKRTSGQISYLYLGFHLSIFLIPPQIAGKSHQNETRKK